MIANKWGRIINIASAHGLVGSAFKSAYVAAKHGMLGLTKVTALETAEQGITCNAICPGYVYTPLVEAQIEGQAKAHGIPREQVIRDVLLAQQPNKRFATTDELGGIAVFLASDAAASITGSRDPGRRRLDRALSEEQGTGRSSHDRATKKLTPLEAVNEIRNNKNGQVVLVLQGGGALGAYQGGVYQALHEAGDRARLDHRHLDRRHQCGHHHRQSGPRTGLPGSRSSGGASSARPSGAPFPPGPASPMRSRHG